MTRAAALETYPPVFFEVFQRVQEQGLFSVKLESERQALATRQRFYAFFYSLKELEPEGRGAEVNNFQIRRRKEWLEISRKDEGSAIAAIKASLDRGWSIPINTEDIGDDDAPIR